MSGVWAPPLTCSVIGAAHRRRGLPCQDASQAWSLQDADGQTLRLMVVADGHGHRRHWLSQIGSALACEQSRQALAAALRQTPLRDPRAWQARLERELPATIVSGWLAAIAADWQQRPEANAQPFSAATYGCTLGIVLMAPLWWAHTGLGDWDLVAIAADGSGRLVSEEPPGNDGPEATASLCLRDAAALFHLRTGLDHQPPRALVLSTDGVRKSCASDGDFLQLCRELSAITDRAQLAEGLEQITSQGSGDDVSVALGIVSSPMASGNPQIPLPPLQIQPPHRPWRRLGLGLGITALTGAIGLFGWSWWRQPQRPLAVSPLQREVQRQCAEPQRIRATLNQRRPQFEQVLAGGGPALVAAAARDPLGAIIARSHPRAGDAIPTPELCAPLRQELSRQWQQRSRPMAASHGSDPTSGRMPASSPRP